MKAQFWNRTTAENGPEKFCFIDQPVCFESSQDYYDKQNAIQFCICTFRNSVWLKYSRTRELYWVTIRSTDLCPMESTYTSVLWSGFSLMGLHGTVCSIFHITSLGYWRFSHISSSPNIILFLLIFLIEVQMIYNILLVSGIQQSDSDMYFILFPLQFITRYQIQFPALYSRNLSFIYFIYSDLHLQLLWETNIRKHCYDLCWIMFCLCSFLGVLWYHNEYLSFQAILSLFLCLV